MRVQFTNEENEIINKRREENKTSQDLVLPVELQGKIVTLGMEITDVHTFNAFIEQSLKDPKIAEQIGAKIVHVDYRPPYNTANILFLQTWINNYINGLVYGPKPAEEPAEPVPEEESGISDEELVSEKRPNIELPSSEEDDDGDYGEESNS